MSPAVTSYPGKRHGPDRDASPAPSSPAGSAQTMPQSVMAAKEMFQPDFGDPAEAGLSPPPLSAEPTQTMRHRLLKILDGWIANECRTIVDRRLAGVQAAARTALLPSGTARAELADRVLGTLKQAAIVGSLSPSIETERLLLLDLACGVDPMVRETALDALSGITRGTTTSRDRIREFCAVLLAPALALLGAGSDSMAGHQALPAGPPIAAATGEAAFLGALQRDDADATQRILASHAGIAPDRVAQAIWTRDARALLGLAWKAGYSMRAARLLQIQLAGIPPEIAIGSTSTGAVPPGRSELAWQLALLAES